jgi:signal transduction histidine kinase
MQIRTKLTLQFILVVSLIIAFSFGTIYYSSSNYRKREFYTRLESKANITFDMFLNYKRADPTLLILFDRSQKDKLPGECILIYDQNLNLMYQSIDSIPIEIDESTLKKLRTTGRIEYSQKVYEILGLRAVQAAKPVYILSMAIDKYGFSKLNNLRITLAILIVLIISIVAIAGWIYSGRALSPLTNVINQVEKINIESLDKRLNTGKNKDEIGRLIDTFNTMLDQIERSVQLQRLFVSGASHELKNPLTSITSQLQVVLMSDRSNQEYKTILNSIIEDIKRLNRTTHDLIEYARLSHNDEVQFSKVRLDDVLWQCRDIFLSSHANCKVSLHFNDLPSNEADLIVNANEALLLVAFNNLIDNACKFSANQSCNITFTVISGSLEIKFSDTGKGMSPQELMYIFEPFYRANNTAEVKGHGLGLALTKRIVDVHGATIKVHSQSGKGADFTVNFKV